MAIDPLRTTGGRIIQLRDRPTRARSGAPASDPAPPTEAARVSRAGVADPPAEAAGDGPAGAPAQLNVRKALVLARIQKDYYSQAHVRERVIDSLLQFLDEE